MRAPWASLPSVGGLAAFSAGLVLWYAGNIAFTVGFKRALHLLPDVMLLTSMQFAAGTVALMAALMHRVVEWPSSLYTRRKLVPSAALLLLGTLCTNLSMAYVRASFTHVIKTCEPLFTVSILYLWKGTVPGLSSILALMTTICGVMLATVGHHLHPDQTDRLLHGVLLALCSNVFLQGRNVLNKHLMSGSVVRSASAAPLVDTPPPESAIPPTALLLLTFGIAMPMQLVANLAALIYWGWPDTSWNISGPLREPLIVMVSTPAAFVTYQLASMELLQSLDPVLHAVLNGLKRAIVIGFAALLLQEAASSSYFIGAAVSVIGVGGYSMSKQITRTASHCALRLILVAVLCASLVVMLHTATAAEGASGGQQLRTRATAEHEQRQPTGAGLRVAGASTGTGNRTSARSSRRAAKNVNVAETTTAQGTAGVRAADTFTAGNRSSVHKSPKRSKEAGAPMRVSGNRSSVQKMRRTTRAIPDGATETRAGEQLGSDSNNPVVELERRSEQHL